MATIQLSCIHIKHTIRLRDILKNDILFNWICFFKGLFRLMMKLHIHMDASQ